ncbi:hypothetical protein, partial [Vibrio cholerae]|uniref:hypothetical protein n=1 Tax=Vibrio cholerae TaxID=666 RepID=UPI001F393A37
KVKITKGINIMGKYRKVDSTCPCNMTIAIASITILISILMKADIVTTTGSISNGNITFLT